MNRFRLTAIPGTEKIVEKELLTKFPHVEILAISKGKIDFQVADLVLDNFRYLLSPLRIQDTNHKDYDLFKRAWRLGFVPAGINPSLAYCLCDLANLEKDDIVLDPFCGGSTIPITAAVYFGIKKAIASDISGKAIDISQKNWEASKVKKDRFVLFKSDVSRLRLAEKTISKVVTNLPFGIRVGSHYQNERVYQVFAECLKKILTSDGLAIVLTQEKELMSRFMKDGLILKVVTTLDVGGLTPSVFKITRNSEK